MRALSFSEASKNLDALIDRVVADHVPVAITRCRGEGVVLVSESDWACMQERIHSPANSTDPHHGAISGS